MSRSTLRFLLLYVLGLIVVCTGMHCQMDAVMEVASEVHEAQHR